MATKMALAMAVVVAAAVAPLATAAPLVPGAAAPAEDLSYLYPSMAPLAQHHEAVAAASGAVTAATAGRATTDGDAAATVAYETVVVSRGASWMRITFDPAATALGLRGGAFHPSRPAGTGAYLRLTSLQDGSVQHLDAVSFDEWYGVSAYLNGDAVRVELLFPAGADVDEAETFRVAITGAWVGEGAAGGPSVASICDGQDDRLYSPEVEKAARYLGSGGCSGWIFDDVHNCFGSAGHCGVDSQGSGTMQFNVPLSSTSGSINHPPPSEQFSVDAASVQRANGGVGNDWMYLGTFVNSETGLTAVEHVNNYTYALGSTSPPSSDSLAIHIAGHGTCEVAYPQGACASREYSQVNKNDTYVGDYTLSGTSIRYRPDTTGGNSGSGVEVVHNYAGGPSAWVHETIGVHTHGGCSSTGGSNAGTALQNSGWSAALASPSGVCASGPRNTPLRRSLL